MKTHNSAEGAQTVINGQTNYKHPEPCKAYEDYSCGCGWCHDCGWEKDKHQPGDGERQTEMSYTNTHDHKFEDADGIGECSVRVTLPGNGWYRCAQPAASHKPVAEVVTSKETSEEPEYLCMCGHRRGDHQGMGPSRGKPVMSACGACECQQWRPSKKRITGETTDSSAAPTEHKWTGCRRGGSPAEADSYEWVRYCERCGIEDTCEDPLPPCVDTSQNNPNTWDRPDLDHPRPEFTYDGIDAVIHACGLLDVIKQEWGEAWSAHDQAVRDGLSRMAAPKPEPPQEFEEWWQLRLPEMLKIPQYQKDFAEVLAKLAWNAARKAPSIDQEKLVAAINWACGCGDSDFSPPNGAATSYWWRTELVRLAGLTWDRESCKYILGEPGKES